MNRIALILIVGFLSPLCHAGPLQDRQKALFADIQQHGKELHGLSADNFLQRCELVLNLLETPVDVVDVQYLFEVYIPWRKMMLSMDVYHRLSEIAKSPAQQLRSSTILTRARNIPDVQLSSPKSEQNVPSGVGTITSRGVGRSGSSGKQPNEPDNRYGTSQTTGAGVIGATSGSSDREPIAPNSMNLDQLQLPHSRSIQIRR